MVRKPVVQDLDACQTSSQLRRNPNHVLAGSGLTGNSRHPPVLLCRNRLNLLKTKAPPLCSVRHSFRGKVKIPQNEPWAGGVTDNAFSDGIKQDCRLLRCGGEAIHDSALNPKGLEKERNLEPCGIPQVLMPRVWQCALGHMREETNASISTGSVTVHA